MPLIIDPTTFEIKNTDEVSSSVAEEEGEERYPDEKQVSADEMYEFMKRHRDHGIQDCDDPFNGRKGYICEEHSQQVFYVDYNELIGHEDLKKLWDEDCEKFLSKEPVSFKNEMDLLFPAHTPNPQIKTLNSQNIIRRR